MKKHTSEEAFYERMRNLASVNETAKKEFQIRNMGTLIDYKRAADGIAYGIIKENHHYYVKKGGLKQDPNVADFAYIGGLSNIKDFEYKSLSEAEKQRNMLFHTINEATSLSGIKATNKKSKLNENKAEEEINASAEMVDDLDAATDAKQQAPAEPSTNFDNADASTPEIPLEKPATDADTENPAPEEGGEEMTVDNPTSDDKESTEDKTIPDDEAHNGNEASVDGDIESGSKDEIKSDIGKIGEKILNKELNDAKVTDYVSMFLGYFKNNFIDMPIEDRKELAKKILEVTKEKNIEDLETNLPNEPEGIEEEQCSECGSFPMYAESRGYTKDSIMECGEEEMTNLVSGYANAHNDGMNDGDFKVVALFITPEIINKLKSDYGHDDYAEKLNPYVNQLGECKFEEKQAQINELDWSGLKNVGKFVGKGIVDKGRDLYKAGAEKVGQVSQGVKNVAGQVQQAYHTGALSNEMKKANELGNQFASQIIALQQRAQKAGQALDTNRLLTGINNQIKSGKPVNVAATSAGGAIRTSEGLDDTNKVEVQPIKEIEFAPAGETMGVITPNSSMNESEQKLRQYIRTRLQEKIGMKKEVLSEGTKSKNLQKLDTLIDKQFTLFESEFKKKIDKK